MCKIETIYESLNKPVRACSYCMMTRNFEGAGEFEDHIFLPYVIKNGGRMWCNENKVWVEKNNTCACWYLDRYGYTPFGGF
jgi:hypothetical protein